jgi:four helix bundle protein
VTFDICLMADVDKKFRFRKFKVYTDGRIFIFEVKTLAREKFPKFELFSLTNQLCRAADSIILNIAEGSDRSTDKDFAHFLNQAHTSLNEVVACLDIALDNKYITGTENLTYINKAAELANQLTAFRDNLLNRPTK